MAQKTVYDLIKKQNGEHFAKAVRNYDNGIFDVPNIVDIVKYAGRDAEPIMNYLASLKHVYVTENAPAQDPFKLLESVGYSAVYANTLQKQNAIRPYFAPDEGLCTFRDGTRYKKYYILNVVHRDAAKLRRADFKNPMREDKYGTSVMSIQILKSGGFISIKNRYNHTVDNPDNTYYSNPDNIVPGLSAALKKYFNVDFSSHPADLPNDYKLVGDQICKIHTESGNVFFGADFVVYDGTTIYPINKDYEVIMDSCVFDLRPASFGPVPYRRHSADKIGQKIFADQCGGQRPTVTRNKQNGTTRIEAPNGTWIELRDGQIIGVSMPHLTDVPDCFFLYSTALSHINLPKACTIGDCFLMYNQDLERLDLPNVESVGESFLLLNRGLKTLNMPKVRSVDTRFLGTNRLLKTLNMPNLSDMPDLFLEDNILLERAKLTRVRTIGDDCFYSNLGLVKIDLPNVESIGRRFLHNNRQLSHINLPNVREIEDCFLPNADRLETINAPKLQTLGDFGCLSGNPPMQKQLQDTVAKNQSVGQNVIQPNQIPPAVKLLHPGRTR